MELIKLLFRRVLKGILIRSDPNIQFSNLGLASIKIESLFGGHVLHSEVSAHGAVALEGVVADLVAEADVSLRGNSTYTL